MGEERPSLRTLYSEGEREALLRSLAPKSPESEDDDFRKGLGASNEQMELVVELVKLAFEKSGLSEYDSFEDPEALSRLNVAVAEPVQWLAENLPEVPTWFTNQWCTHIIELLWKRRVEELADRRAKIRDGKLPQTVGSARNTPEPDAFPHRRSAPGSPALQDMILRIEVLNDRRDKEPQMVSDLPIKKFLLPGKPADEFSSYSYNIFVREFEKAINRGFGPYGPSITINQGTLGYLNHDNRFKSFYRQQSFEFALEFLFGFRDDKNILSFIFRKETEDERNARLDERAEQLSKVSLPLPIKSTARSNVSIDPANSTSQAASTKASSTKTSSTKWRSPPPSPAPQRPLPPLPTHLSSKQLAVLNSPERARDPRIRKLAKAWEGVAAKQAKEARQEAAKVISKSTTSSDLNKPLPPIPAVNPRSSDKARDAKQATPRTSTGTRPLAKDSSSIPRKTTTADKGQKSTTSKQGSTVRRPFLVKGGGLSTRGPPPDKPQAGISKPASGQTPTPLVQQTKRAWEAGNKSNPNVNNLPLKKESATRTHAIPVSKKGGILRGGTSRLGTSVSSSNSKRGADKRSNTSLSRPSLRNVEAKKTPKVVTPQDGPSRNPSQRAERERWETLTNPEDHTRRSPTKPKKPTLIGVAMTAAKKRVSSMLSPRTPKSPYSDVQELLGPEPGEPLTPPPNQQEHEAGRKSNSSALTRITGTLKDKEVVVEPAKKKTLGLVKVPKPRLASKTDRFESQDQRYPQLYTEIERRTYRRGGDELVDTQAEIFLDDENTRGIEEVDGVDGEETADEEEDSKTSADYMVEQYVI